MTFQWLNPVENPLVKPFYKRHMPYSKPNKADKVAVLRTAQGQQIIACARIRTIGNYTLLTGMLVDPAVRQQGVGHQLLQHMRSAFIVEHTFIFSLTPLVNFYQQHGFTPITTAPNDIQQRFEAYTKQGKDLTLMAFKKLESVGISAL